MFKKQTDLPPEPQLVTSKQICEDLSVSDQDPLYTDAVKEIILVYDQSDPNFKTESFNPKSFQIIDRVLKVKEDMVVQRNQLIEQIDELFTFSSDLKRVQEVIKNDIGDSK